MNKQQGFTLIELMIVVAIIAILAAIALPAYNEYRQKSADGACLAEAKAWANSAVAGISSEMVPNAPPNIACASDSGAAAWIAAGQATGALTFTPQTKGGTPTNVTCQMDSATCVQ